MSLTTSTSAKQAIDEAYREAGHAVAAWRLGVMLKRLNLKKNGKGKNVWNDPLRNVDFDWLQRNRSAMVERLAAVLVAGVVAQTSYADPSLNEKSAKRLAEAKQLLDSHVASLYGTSIESLQKNWREFFEQDDVRLALDVVAARLVDKGKLGGKAATRLLDEYLIK